MESKIIALLKETLSSVQAASDEKIGWKNMISLYEYAIEKAENNQYFSIQDAPRIYLEFNHDYTSELFKQIENATNETEQYFKSLLGHYMTGSVNLNRLDDKIKAFTRNSDIYEELINYILAGEQFDETKSVSIEGYTAKQLANETILTPLGAFNYLLYLKEDPEEALADLKAKLPRRKFFYQTD